MDFLIDQKENLLLRVYVIAGASKNEFIGPYGEPIRLKIKTNAIAEDGKANKEIIHFLSKSLKVSKSKIELIRGLTFKEKDFLILEDFETIALRLQKLVNSGMPK